MADVLGRVAASVLQAVDERGFHPPTPDRLCPACRCRPQDFQPDDTVGHAPGCPIAEALQVDNFDSQEEAASVY